MGVDQGGRRVSPQLFNLEAAERWAETSSESPVTRKPFSKVVQVPSLLHDPVGWFTVVDLDGDGKLSRREVVEVLKAQLPLDNAMLESIATDPASQMWERWDPDGSGFIDQAELVAEGGLLQWVLEVCRAAPQVMCIP